MKKIISILTVFLSFFLFPSTSLSEWKYVSINTEGDKFFVDYDQIRQKNGDVYYWILSDYKKPLSRSTYSSKVYTMGDCEIFRVKKLSWIFYKGQMGRGDSEREKGSMEWRYPPPDSLEGIMLNSVCEKI